MPTVFPGDLAALGKFLQRRRERLGLNKTDVAKLAGISARTVRRIENGEHQARRPIYFRLAVALGIPDTELEEYIGEEAA